MSLESDLYPIVAAWLSSYKQCFKTGVNTGLRYSRIDVVGIRDVGGDLSGEVETISVEVKAGREPFATATGQALGYRVYANRVYLADSRLKPFDRTEIEIASHLGVGLLRINGKRCVEDLASPYYKPMTRLNLLLLEKLGLGVCRMCECTVALGSDPKKRFSNLTRENLQHAIDREKGMMFWNREVAERKKRTRVREVAGDTTFERRFICPDCVSAVLSQLRPE